MIALPDMVEYPAFRGDPVFWGGVCKLPMANFRIFAQIGDLDPDPDPALALFLTRRGTILSEAHRSQKTARISVLS